jgi:hypothetical protein
MSGVTNAQRGGSISLTANEVTVMYSLLEAIRYNIAVGRLNTAEKNAVNRVIYKLDKL